MLSTGLPREKQVARWGLWALAVALLAACADIRDPSLVTTADRCGDHTRIWFDDDSAELSDISQRFLDGLVPIWRAGRASLKLVGHADVAGKPDRDRALSRARAESLKAYLQRNGLDAGSILVEARGNAERLVGSGGGPNQRVEVHILKFAARPPC